MSASIEELHGVASAKRLLIALDFDGTVSPLMDEPMAARMIPEAAAAIARLAVLPDTTVAFVSGRSLADLREIAEHGDESPVLLAGSHGAEFWVPGEGAIEPEPDSIDAELRDTLYRHAQEATAHLEGVWIEPKAFGLGVHTRVADASTAAEANATIDALVAAEASHWRRRTGKNIVEYAFRHEGKDSAIAALRQRIGATAVLFAGDDVTDEDALKSLEAGDLGVHVGEGPTAASVCVASVKEMAALLEVVATHRESARE